MDVFDNKDLQTTYGNIKSFVDKLVATDDTIIPLTFLIQALYPKALENLQDFMKKQYTLGYTQAIKDKENEK